MRRHDVISDAMCPLGQLQEMIVLAVTEERLKLLFFTQLKQYIIWMKHAYILVKLYRSFVYLFYLLVCNVYLTVLLYLFCLFVLILMFLVWFV